MGGGVKRKTERERVGSGGWGRGDVKGENRRRRKGGCKWGRGEGGGVREEGEGATTTSIFCPEG